MSKALSIDIKKRSRVALFSIGLFVITYLLTTLIALGLGGAALVAGGLLMASFSVLGVILGLALMIFAGSIVYFLLKGLFKKDKLDRSHWLEVNKEDQPRLFLIIEELTRSIGTDMPKRVYLSNEVNAMVTYDSTFWSIFVPTRKNLVIGMGLLNGISTSELKAILGHEFGHFSQESMKVGSQVYYVNRILHDLLMGDMKLHSAVAEVARQSGIISLFLLFADGFLRGVKWIQAKIYELVNRNFYSLSREMEFQADEIAARAVDPAFLESSLTRMNFTNYCFNATVSIYGGKFHEKAKTKNIYTDFRHTFRYVAEFDELSFAGELPMIDLQEANKFNKSKLVFENQWASHPTLEERIDRLPTSDPSVEPELTRATEVLMDLESVEEKLTAILFKDVKFKEEPGIVSHAEYQREFEEWFLNGSFDKIFNMYYDQKNPLAFDLKEDVAKLPLRSFEELYSDEKVDLVYTELAIFNDIETLKQIAMKEARVKHFEYDGKKYKKKEANVLIKILEKKQEELNSPIKENDIQIFDYFKSIETNEGELEQYYQRFFDLLQRMDQEGAFLVDLQEKLSFVSQQHSEDYINSSFRRFRKFEVDLKNMIQRILDDQALVNKLPPEIIANYKEYLSKDWYYFQGTSFIEPNLQMLFNAIHDYQFSINTKLFMIKKELLDYQADLQKKRGAAVLA